jgi:HAD superfamily hydrolase (TIGR01549 family)
MIRGVFFDVDFTLIHPGPSLQAEGFRALCGKHGVEVDPERFDDAVAQASRLLDAPGEHVHEAKFFIDYTSHVIEQMGGSGVGVEKSAREVYDQWAACQHFSLYDDVKPTLRELYGDGLRVGLISNTHRCLESFRSHFALDGLIEVAISSAQHGYMKPHPSIFRAALDLMGVTPPEAMMVGDHLRHDVDGALAVGMRAVLVRRSSDGSAGASGGEYGSGVRVIRTLKELPGLLRELG